MAGFSTKTFKKHDEYYTPNSAWDAISDYIPKKALIWEPFYGDGSSGDYLRSMGHRVHHEPGDFFEAPIPKRLVRKATGALAWQQTVIVSNPPFSKKKEVLTRLKELDLPFILILPCSTMATQYVRKLFKNDLQILIPRKRIQFQKVVDGEHVPSPGCNFDCYYFCYKMGLSRDITFLE